MRAAFSVAAAAASTSITGGCSSIERRRAAAAASADGRTLKIPFSLFLSFLSLLVAVVVDYCCCCYPFDTARNNTWKSSLKVNLHRLYFGHPTYTTHPFFPDRKWVVCEPYRVSILSQWGVFSHTLMCSTLIVLCVKYGSLFLKRSPLVHVTHSERKRIIWGVRSEGRKIERDFLCVFVRSCNSIPTWYMVRTRTVHV